ncbi:MAG: SH3 domain-containing protein [Anaerolineae bacterium]|jgi:hypothetical protein|nr:SH3 domain-containing protein [Anaerolineae bacterium]
MMVIFRRWLTLVGLMLALAVSLTAHAQPGELSAVVTVVGEGVMLLRAGASNPLPLRVGSVAPLGSGDQLATGVNGRAFVTFPEENRLYLLPDSRYTLQTFAALDGGRFELSASVEGIAIQTFTNAPDDWDYRLETAALTITQPSAHFAVWAIPDRLLETVISADGILTVETPNQPDSVTVSTGEGFFPAFAASVMAMEPPYHAVELLSLALDCDGVVSTGGSDGLRLRRGAALDYPVVGALRDGQSVTIVGTTENGLWFRIPYLTGFGWIFSNLVVTESCGSLPVSPNLVGESNEEISGATAEELTLLEPFYGLPSANPLFYR